MAQVALQWGPRDSANPRLLVGKDAERGVRHTGRITMLVSEVLKPSHAVYHEELCAFEKQFWVCCWALADMEGMAKGQQTDVGLEMPDELGPASPLWAQVWVGPP